MISNKGASALIWDKNGIVQRIRYPPFDHANIDPNSLPITEVILESDCPHHPI